MLTGPRSRTSSLRTIEWVSAYQVGYLTRARRRAGWWVPGRVPLLRITVEPGGSIDFAHPDRGFPGHHSRPPEHRVLRLWSDRLLTVSHGSDWTFVVDSPSPFDRRWLGLLDRAATARTAPGLAVVLASFAGRACPGPFRVADVDPMTYSTLVHVEVSGR